MSIPLYKDEDFTENLTYFLLPASSAGLPNSSNSSALVTGSLTPAQVSSFSGTGTDGWTTITFATPLAVTAGEHLALELAASGMNDGNGPTIDAWAASSAGNPYAAGAGYLRGSTATDVPADATWDPTIFGDPSPQPDFGFITNVQPAAAPEPRLTLVAAAGLVLLAYWRARRRAAC